TRSRDPDPITNRCQLCGRRERDRDRAGRARAHCDEREETKEVRSQGAFLDEGAMVRQTTAASGVVNPRGIAGYHQSTLAGLEKRSEEPCGPSDRCSSSASVTDSSA